jgi:hypothetical protein
MKRKKLLIIICAILLPIIVIGVFIFIYPGENPQSEKKPPVMVSGFIRPSMVIPYLQDGDIILRMSDGQWSSIFSDYSLTDKRFSHLGIVRMRDDNIIMINSVGSIANKNMGVSELSLEYFLKVAKSIAIYRIKSADSTVISDTAVKYIGCPFDFDFDLNDDSKIYCTELLYVALKAAKSEQLLKTRYVEDLGKEVIPLESISNSPDIEEIVYIIRQIKIAGQPEPVVEKQDNTVKVSLLRRFLFFVLKFRDK